MDFNFTRDQERFRRRLREWMQLNSPGDLPARFEETVPFRLDWQRKLHAAGYLALTWPQEYGGQGLTAIEQVIFNQERIQARAPEPLNVIGLNMGGQTILRYGTEEQKLRYLPPLLRGDDIYCQGFSEPNAGSDLSAIATRAEDRGDHYLVNGQKVWTSLAHLARWCLLLAREKRTANPRDGLTYLLVDMTSPGVEVRPLRQLTGEAEFNEIFFNDVHVPKAQLLGEPGAGWSVAMTTLGHERATHGAVLAARAQIIVGDLTQHARRLGRTSDPRVRQRLAQHYIEARLLLLHSYRTVSSVSKSQEPGPEGSLIKLMFSEWNQRVQEEGINLLGSAGLTGSGDPWRSGFLRSRGNTIEAGTSEVQRNVIAERILGLPRNR